MSRCEVRAVPGRAGRVGRTVIRAGRAVAPVRCLGDEHPYGGRAKTDGAPRHQRRTLPRLGGRPVRPAVRTVAGLRGPLRARPGLGRWAAAGDGCVLASAGRLVPVRAPEPVHHAVLGAAAVLRAADRGGLGGHLAGAHPSSAPEPGTGLAAGARRRPGPVAASTAGGAPGSTPGGATGGAPGGRRRVRSRDRWGTGWPHGVSWT